MLQRGSSVLLHFEIKTAKSDDYEFQCVNSFQCVLSSYVTLRICAAFPLVWPERKEKRKHWISNERADFPPMEVLLLWQLCYEEKSAPRSRNLGCESISLRPAQAMNQKHRGISKSIYWYFLLQLSQLNSLLTFNFFNIAIRLRGS